VQGEPGRYLAMPGEKRGYHLVTTAMAWFRKADLRGGSRDQIQRDHATQLASRAEDGLGTGFEMSGLVISQAQNATQVSFVPPANDNESPPAARASRADSASASRGLDAYVRDLRRYPLLDAAAEVEIAKAFHRTQDPRLALQLVRANLRLVVKIAYEYRLSRRDLMDLVQEGNLGLLRAVYRFDPYRGVRLSSYAAWWIRAYMLKFILVNRRLVKIGTTQAQRRLFFNMNRQREELERAGKAHDAGSIAIALAVPEREVQDMERRLTAELSLDCSMRDSDRGRRTLADVIPAASSDRPDVRVENGEVGALLHEKLSAFSKTLTGRDAEIFRDRLLCDSPATLVTIAERFAVTRQRVSQLESRLRLRLRRFLEAEFGADADTLVTDN
jgi:RNA polymerase sigma-32 factor